MRLRPIFLCLLLAGCSTVVSTRHETTPDSRGGLLYYLPRQDIILTVTVAKKEESTSGTEAGTSLRPASTNPNKGKDLAAPDGNGAGDDQKKDNKGKEDDKKKDDEKPLSPTPSPNQGFSGTSGRYTVNVTTTPPYPDRSQAHWLSFGTNWLGKNTLDIGVSKAGLLQSAKSTTEPGILDALTGLARAAAYTAAFDDRVEDPCEKGDVGTYVYRIEIPAQEAEGTLPIKYCGLDASVDQLTESVGGLDKYTPRKSAHGVYYRQAIPYLIEVKNSEIQVAGVLSSPSQSGKYFLPAKSTLFARNHAEFAFVDGMPTLYKQEADGEIVGFLKLPADIIGAYFGAIGEMFTKLSSEPSGEAALIQAQLDLEVVRFRQEQCLAAIQAKNTDAIAATCSAE